MTKEKFEKLPKWVQSYIKVLEKKNEQLISLLQDEEETDVVANLYTSDCKRYIPVESSIRFNISSGLWVDIRLRKQDALGNVVEVVTSDQAIVLPESSNHFHIVSARRFKVVAELEMPTIQRVKKR
jgi:hypothetical protein